MVSAGLISIDLEALSVNEKVNEAIIPIVRIGGSDGTVSVDYSINNGTANEADDFIAASGTLTFLPEETSKEIVVPIVDDQIPEIDETFSIAIGNAIGTDLGETRTATITIIDDDATKLTSLAFSQAEYNFSEEQGEATITVIRTGDDSDTVSLDYATKDDYARAESDYTAVLGTLIFEPGERSKTFTVSLLDDNLPELDEALNLILSNPVGIELGPQKNARLIVEDNDVSPFIFKEEVIVSGLGQVTAFDWTLEGTILIAERDGVVRVFDNDQVLEQPFIDISENVNKSTQRGLLGLAVHPEFPENPYVYLAFSYDPPDVETDQADVGRVTRLIRVTADINSNYTTAVPGSEVVLLETPPVNNFHAAGAIRFGNDGSLFFSHGDGAPVGNPASIQNAELLQSLDHPFGKLFRIDPITGEGYPDNPFYDGDTTSIRSKVYNYGLRNPWRFTFHPETGEPFIGDVGWADWEEINTGRGVNFGWPLYEGGNGVSLTTKAFGDDPEYQDIYNGVSEVTSPIYARNHEYGGDSILVGDFYTGTTYPELYQGALFFTDYYSTSVNALIFDDQGNVDSVTPIFEKERDRGTTQISMGSDSNLYFSDLETGEISRWVYENPEEDNDQGSETVYSFFLPDRGVHFYTATEIERDSIIENLPELSFEGASFVGAPEPPTEKQDSLAEVKPVYRFLNNDTGVHLYTIDEIERNAVEQLSNYTAEDIAYYAYETEQEGTIPLYRLYNSVIDTHFFTPRISERNSTLENLSDSQLEGYRDNEEGVAFYVYPTTEI